MLNYIWLGLIVIGIGVAVYGDVHDISSDKYHNKIDYNADIQFQDTLLSSIRQNRIYPCNVTIEGHYYGPYSLPPTPQALWFPKTPLRADFIAKDSSSGILQIHVEQPVDIYWQDILKDRKFDDFLVAHVGGLNLTSKPSSAVIHFEPIRFVRLNSVTNDSIIKYAKTAVELAIGLIGIMALWLGLMKIAEQSGLVAILAKALRPITTRLFPDVPTDHPAMGAMIMNISANMLGLANAATPLGLKAMEELNKLNKKVGTATDAMCTFLVINTSNVQLIPATTIAIRAAAGSTNPTEILGPVIVATIVTWVVGVTTVKLLARLPMFRKQLDTEQA